MTRRWLAFLLIVMLGAGTAWSQDSVAVTVKTGKSSSHSSKKKTSKKTSKKSKKSTKKQKKTKAKKSKTKAKKSKGENDPTVETEITHQAVTIDLQDK